MGTVKYTGPVASFHCPTNAEIRSLKVHFNPKQEGSGDPSPENVRPIVGWDGVEQYYSGKNIGHIVGYSTTTLTTPYGNRIITNTYGTTLSTIEPERSIIITQTQAPETSNKSSYKNGYMAIELDNLIFSTSYDISFKVTNITSNPLNATLQNLGLGVPNGTRRGPTEIRDNILIYKNFPFNQRDANPNQMDFDLRICGMSFTLSDFMITPAGMNDGVYESYNGSITNYEFGVLGKNKFDYANANIVDKKRRDDNGNVVGDSTGSYCQTLIPVKPNTTYTVSGYAVNNDSKRIYYIDAEENFIARTAAFGTSSSYTFITPNNCYYVQIQNREVGENASWETVQLELGSTATTYEPYDPNKTVYGGWVDLITGEVVQTHAIYTFTGEESLTRTNYLLNPIRYVFDARYNTSIGYSSKYELSEVACNKLNFETGRYHNVHEGCIAIGVSKHTVSILFNDTDVFGSTAEEAKAKLAEWYDNGEPMVVAAKLQEEYYVHYQLAPTTMQTFLAQNNIWSNADYVEVEYDLHETQSILARKQFIVANQPHIVKPAAAPLQNFVTDVPAPLKECKVYFSPMQDTSNGVPSPDNICPISGWNELELYLRGVNLQDEIWEVGQIDNTTGQQKIANDSILTTNYLPVPMNTNLKVVVPENTSVKIASYDRNKQFLDYLWRDYQNHYNRKLNQCYLKLQMRSTYGLTYNNDISLNYPTTETAYTPYQGTTIPITFPSEAGTVYGGYVDLISGEVWKVWDIYDLGDLTWSYNTNNNCFIAGFNNFTNEPRVQPRIYSCSHYKYEYVMKVNSMADFTINDSSQLNRRQIQIHDSNYDDSTLTAFQSYMSGIKITYLLATPVLVGTITPTTLKTLRGINNIWSSANDNIEVAYWSH